MASKHKRKVSMKQKTEVLARNHEKDHVIHSVVYVPVVNPKLSVCSSVYINKRVLPNPAPEQLKLTISLPDGPTDSDYDALS